MKRAVIVTGRLHQDIEAQYPYYRLLEAGYSVDVAVREQGPCAGITGLKMNPNIDVAKLRAADHDLLILPGGVKAMEHMRLDEGLLWYIRTFHEAGKVIGCICSGAQLLISAKVVKGKRISAYYSMKDDVVNAGAEFVDEPAVTDGRIVTSPHYKFLGPWMKAVVSERR